MPFNRFRLIVSNQDFGTVLLKQRSNTRNLAFVYLWIVNIVARNEVHRHGSLLSVQVHLLARKRPDNVYSDQFNIPVDRIEGKLKIPP